MADAIAEHPLSIENILSTLSAVVRNSDLVTNTLAPLSSDRERYKIIASEEIAKLLGPKLFPTLDSGETGPINKPKWRTWADKSLMGSNRIEDETKVKALDQTLAQIIPEITIEHFVLDFNSVKPDWKDVKVNWKLTV